MQRNHGCHTIDHALSRRGFLASSAVAGVAGLSAPAISEELKGQQKRVLPKLDCIVQFYDLALKVVA